MYVYLPGPQEMLWGLAVEDVRAAEGSSRGSGPPVLLKALSFALSGWGPGCGLGCGPLKGKAGLSPHGEVLQGCAPDLHGMRG